MKNKNEDEGEGEETQPNYEKRGKEWRERERERERERVWHYKLKKRRRCFLYKDHRAMEEEDAFFKHLGVIMQEQLKNKKETTNLTRMSKKQVFFNRKKVYKGKMYTRSRWQRGN